MTDWGTCKGAIGTVYGSCEGAVGTEWESCDACPDDVNISSAVIATQDVFTDPSTPGNTVHSVVLEGCAEQWELKTITLEIDDYDTTSSGSDWYDAITRFYWHNIDVSPPSAFNDYRMLAGEHGALSSGPRTIVYDVELLSGDHIVTNGDLIEFMFWDEFDDAAPLKEGTLTNIKMTFTGVKV